MKQTKVKEACSTIASISSTREGSARLSKLEIRLHLGKHTGVSVYLALDAAAQGRAKLPESENRCW